MPIVDFVTLSFQKPIASGKIALKITRPAVVTIVLFVGAEVAKIEGQFQQGIITAGERHNKIVDVWSAATEKVGDELYKTIDRNISKENPKPTELNPIFMMVDSKARGSKLQIRQLAGMRGLMADPSGNIIERPGSRPTAPARASPTRP